MKIINCYKILRLIGISLCTSGCIFGLILVPTLVFPITGVLYKGYFAVIPMVIVGLVLALVFDRKIGEVESEVKSS